MGSRFEVVSGLAWTYAERTVAQLINVVITIVLARIIAPEEYGVIAIATVLIAIADTFAVNGMGSALIQKKDADSLDFSSVFYFNIVLSLVFYAVFYAISDPIASFYQMEELGVVIKVMSIRIPIAAINSVQQAYVSKGMQFKKFFFATLVGTVISGAIGLLMAYLGYGIWALVFQYLINAIVGTVVLWFTAKWRPKLCFSLVRLKGLVSYGWKILASSLLITVYGNIQDLVIGKKFSASDLAFFNRGRQFPQLITSNINSSMAKVLFPAIANEQESVSTVRSITRRSIRVCCFVITPLLVGLAFVGDGVVELLLTDKWLECVPYLQVMCVVYLLQPIQTTSIQAMKAIGRSDTYLMLEIVKKVFGVGVLFVSVFFYDSVIAIVIGSLIAELFSTLANMPANAKLLGYTFFDQVKDIVPPLLYSAVMALVVYAASFLAFDLVLRLIIQISLGITSYLAIAAVCKDNSLLYIVDTLKRAKGQ